MTNDPAFRFPPPSAAASLASALPEAAPAADQPPCARPIPHFDDRHNDIRLDEFYWLRHRENPEVIAYLEAENAWTATSMRHTEELQRTIYRELVGRIRETDLSVPERIDGFLYYTRTEA